MQLTRYEYNFSFCNNYTSFGTSLLFLDFEKICVLGYRFLSRLAWLLIVIGQALTQIFQDTFVYMTP